MENHKVFEIAKRHIRIIIDSNENVDEKIGIFLKQYTDLTYKVARNLVIDECISALQLMLEELSIPQYKEILNNLKK